MSFKHLGGKDARAIIDGTLINIEKIDIDIETERQPVYENGVPNGFVDGKVSATVKLTFNKHNFALFKEKAKAAGSWQGIPPFDFDCVSTAGTQSETISAFGVLPDITSLLSAETESNSAQTVEVEGAITSPDFIHIDGVPYLEAESIADLVRS